MRESQKYRLGGEVVGEIEAILRLISEVAVAKATPATLLSAFAALKDIEIEVRDAGGELGKALTGCGGISRTLSDALRSVYDLMLQDESKLDALRYLT